MVHEASNTFTTIREKFHPIALVGGRQYAAIYAFARSKGGSMSRSITSGYGVP